jgi:hypothetical protein
MRRSKTLSLEWTGLGPTFEGRTFMKTKCWSLVICCWALGANVVNGQAQPPTKLTVLKAVVEQAHNLAANQLSGPCSILGPRMEDNSLEAQVDALFLQSRLRSFGLSEPGTNALPRWIALVETGTGNDLALGPLDLQAPIALKSVKPTGTRLNPRWARNTPRRKASLQRPATNWVVRLELLEVISPTQFQRAYAGRVASNSDVPLSHQQAVPSLLGALMGQFPGEGPQPRHINVDVLAVPGAVSGETKTRG